MFAKREGVQGEGVTGEEGGSREGGEERGVHGREEGVSDEGHCLLRPTPRDIACQHHQPGSATWPDQLWVRAHFPPPCSDQNSPVHISSPSVPSQCNDDTTVVSTASCAPPKKHREAVHHNLQTEAIIHGNWEVEVAHEHVCGDSPSCLSTDARRSTLHGESPSSQTPPLERKMHDGGQSCQRDDHIGTNAK